jgi:hypothetical protein
MSAVFSKARIVLIALAKSLGGNPPLRRRTRGAIRPATVHSRIRLRSNSGQGGENVEDEATCLRICFDLVRQRFKVDSTLFKFSDDPYQVGQISSQPVLPGCFRLKP